MADNAKNSGPDSSAPTEDVIAEAFGLDPDMPVGSAAVLPDLSERARRAITFNDPNIPLAGTRPGEGRTSGSARDELNNLVRELGLDEPEAPESPGNRLKTREPVMGVEVELSTGRRVQIQEYSGFKEILGDMVYTFITDAGEEVTSDTFVDPQGKPTGQYGDYLRATLEIPDLIEDIAKFIENSEASGFDGNKLLSDGIKYGRIISRYLESNRLDSDNFSDGVYFYSLETLIATLDELSEHESIGASQREATAEFVSETVPWDATAGFVIKRVNLKRMPSFYRETYDSLRKNHPSIGDADLAEEAIKFTAYTIMKKLDRKYQTRTTYADIKNLVAAGRLSKNDLSKRQLARLARRIDGRDSTLDHVTDRIISRFNKKYRIEKAAEFGDMGPLREELARLEVRQEIGWVRKATLERLERLYQKGLATSIAKNISDQELSQNIHFADQDIRHFAVIAVMNDETERRDLQDQYRNTRLRRALRRYHNLSIPVKVLTGLPVGFVIAGGAAWLGGGAAVGVAGVGIWRGARMGLNRTAAAASGAVPGKPARWLDRKVASAMRYPVQWGETMAHKLGPKLLTDRKLEQRELEGKIGVGFDKAWYFAGANLDALAAGSELGLIAQQAVAGAAGVRRVEHAQNRRRVRNTAVLVGAGTALGVVAKASSAHALASNRSVNNSGGGHSAYETSPPTINTNPYEELPPSDGSSRGVTIPPRATVPDGGATTSTEYTTSSSTSSSTTSTTLPPASAGQEIPGQSTNSSDTVTSTTSPRGSSTSSSTTTTSTSTTSTTEVQPPSSQPNSGSNASGNGGETPASNPAEPIPTPNRINGVPADKWNSMTSSQQDKWNQYTRGASDSEKRAFANYLVQVDEQRRAFVAEQDYPQGYLVEHPVPEETNHLLDVNLTDDVLNENPELSEVREVAKAAWIDATGTQPTPFQLREYSLFLEAQGQDFGVIENGRYISGTGRIPIWREPISNILELTEEERRRRLLGALATN